MRAFATLLALATIGTTLQAQTLTGLFIDRPQTIGGETIQGEVVLESAAPSGGTHVTLSDDSGSINTPPGVTVPQGKTGASVTCQTGQVGSATQRRIFATLGQVTKTSVVTLLPVPRLQKIQARPSELVGGDDFVGEVFLTSVSGNQGFFADLSTNSSGIQIPATVGWAVGARDTRFNGKTPSVGADAVRQISASHDGFTVTTSILLHPKPVMVSARLTKNFVKGGEQTGLFITLSGFPRQQGSVITVTEDSQFVTPSDPIVVRDQAGYGINTSQVSTVVVVPIRVTLDSVTKVVTLVVHP